MVIFRGRRPKTVEEALDRSIQHWQDNVDADHPNGTSVAAEACALCAMFWKRDCIGCPVFKATGEYLCKESPYFAAADACESWAQKPLVRNRRRIWRQRARAMLRFLKALKEG